MTSSLRFAATIALALAAAGCGDSTGPGDAPDARPIVYFRLTDDGWTLFRTTVGGTPAEIELGDRSVVFPAVSPDGRQLAFISETAPWGAWVADIDGSNARLVHPDPAIERIAWSPDGDRLAIAVEGEILIVGVDDGDPHSITGGIAMSVFSPAWSSTGRIAFMAFEPATGLSIYTMDADGSNVDLVAAGGEMEARDPAWSPDGSHLAFSLEDFGSSSIHVVELATGQRRRVSPAATWGFSAFDLGPVWSPSGRWIAFHREHGVCEGPRCVLRADVHVVRADGSDLRNVTAGSPWGGVRPAW